MRRASCAGCARPLGSREPIAIHPQVTSGVTTHRRTQEIELLVARGDWDLPL